MLDSRLNDLITEGRLPEFTIIRAERLECQSLDGKKVIIIRDAEVVLSGAEVEERIGNLRAICSDGTVNTNQHASKMLCMCVLYKK